VPGTCGRKPDAYGPVPDTYGRKPDAYGPVPDTYGRKPDAYGPVPDAYGRKPDAYGRVPGLCGRVPGPCDREPSCAGGHDSSDQVKKPCPVLRPSSPRATLSRNSRGGAKRSPSSRCRCSAMASRTSRPTRSVERSGPIGWR